MVKAVDEYMHSHMEFCIVLRKSWAWNPSVWLSKWKLLTTEAPSCGPVRLFLLICILQHVICDFSKNAPSQRGEKVHFSQSSYFSQHSAKSNYCVSLFLRNDIYFLKPNKNKTINCRFIPAKEEASLIVQGRAVIVICITLPRFRIYFCKSQKKKLCAILIHDS